MHSKLKFHSDLKPLKIFVSGDLASPQSVTAKLGDFGLVKDVDHSLITSMSMKGTYNYFLEPQDLVGGLENLANWDHISHVTSRHVTTTSRQSKWQINKAASPRICGLSESFFISY